MADRFRLVSNHPVAKERQGAWGVAVMLGCTSRVGVVMNCMRYVLMLYL